MDVRQPGLSCRETRQAAAGPRPARTRVAVIVPCYNEEPALHHLRDRLRLAQAALAERYDAQLLFVDDGSVDRTWPLLRELFGGWANSTLLRHEHNRGLTAAVLTGLRHAEPDIVCCIDADCTYDPCELVRMIPLLGDGVDLVTASPYHPQGAVRNVPAWRLKLSKSASLLYRRVLHNKLATYTSCFRVYRKSAFANLAVGSPGFLGITELLVRLDLAGGRVVEYPTTLDVRAFGQSKMRILRVIGGHLRLLARLLCLRLFRAGAPARARRSRSQAPDLRSGGVRQGR
jgi:dolichol-phosphate mannosyltransferase